MTRHSVFHIVSAPEWERAVVGGRFAPESLASEGFVHLSDRHQVASVANERYHDRRDLVVVELDPSLFDHELVDEDTYGKGQTFPHLYGAIPTSAAVAIHPLSADADGRFHFPA